MKDLKSILVVPVLLGVLVLTGCATDAPHAKFSQAIAADSRVRANDDAKVTVESSGKAAMLSYEKMRLTERTQQILDHKKALNPAAGDKKAYEIEIMITEYEKGSAFARAMIAGAGQIHISGTVTSYLLPERKKVGEFTLRKTFAWGGLYGGTTTIEDAEVGFSEGIANALTGHEEEQPDSKQQPHLGK